MNSVGSSATGRPALICLPIIEWTFRLQRPQHILHRLGANGWKILYLDPECDPNLNDVEISSIDTETGIWQVRVPCHRRRNLYRDRLSPSDVERMTSALVRMRESLALHTGVLYCQLPFWYPIVDALGTQWGWPIVYDRMDDHSQLATNAPEMVALESDLMQRADLVVATAEKLETDARRHNPNTIRIGNGCDPGIWKPTSHATAPGEDRPPVVGYFGAISEWFDVDLVVQSARRNPAIRFELIGSTYGADVARLAAEPNVELKGEITYHDLPNHAQKFDVGIIPFRKTPLTDATDPVKFWEMMALGIPIVATPLRELERHADLVDLAPNVEAFQGAIRSALRERPDDPRRGLRRLRAIENSWDRKTEALDGAIAGLFPMASICIVSYNNPDIIHACLTSILATTEWPRYEVIVVDNASEKRTLTVLREVAASDPRIRLILNRENRGFPAACNQAAEHATGEILCFLNDDTVVTRGWLSALAASAIGDPSIGMTGPTTNAIANQAKVATDYQDLYSMAQWARDFTSSRFGESFEIPMLALFCVVLRRDVWQQVGRLDERFGVGMFEDDDFCRRLQSAGYRLVCRRDAFVHHWHQASFGRLDRADFERIFEHNRRTYTRKWKKERNGN